MSGTILYKHKCLLPNTHQRLQVSCIKIILVLLEGWRVCVQTINDSSIDLERFPASKVRQIAKKMKASKTTAHHIKEVASDPEVAQINLMRISTQTSHQASTRRNINLSSQDHTVTRGIQVNTINIKCHPTRNLILNKPVEEKKRCSKCGDSKHEEGFKCPAKKFQCKTCNTYGHFACLCYKKSVSFKSKTPKVHQLQAGQV